MKAMLFLLALFFLPSCIQGEKAPVNEQSPVKQITGEAIATSDLDHIHVLAVSPRGEIYMGYHEGLAVSYDDGNTWRGIKVSEEKLEDFMALALDPDNPSIIYAGGHGHGVWKSEDAGNTWKLYNKGLPSKPDVHALAVTPGNPDIVYAMISGKEMYRSDDGGKSWRRLETGLDTYAVTSIAVDLKDHNRLYVGGTGIGVLVSMNGSESWSPAGKELRGFDVPAILTDSKGNLYAGTKAGIFISEDKGKAWKMLKELGVEALGINPADPSYMVAATKTGLYRSTDGGFVWSVVFEIKEKGQRPQTEGEEELIQISGPAETYRPTSWKGLGRDVEGLVIDAEAAFDGAFDDTSTYATVRAQGCDSNFAAVYEWTIKKGSGDPVLYYHWDFVKEVDRASIGVFSPVEKSWEELYAVVDMSPMKKRSLRIPQGYIGPNGEVKIYFEVVTPCSVGEMRLYDVYLTVPR